MNNLKPKWMKGGGFDKYDCHRPNKTHFIHDDYYVSAEQREFHMHTAYYYGEKGRGTWGGVNKALPKASGMGINIESHYIGKSDND